MTKRDTICLAIIITVALINGTIIGYKIAQIFKINRILEDVGYGFDQEQLNHIYKNRRKHVVVIIATFLAYVAISVFVGGIMYA